ncbi:CRISPR-associated helicase Cas3' [Hutsoniella sourekii]
MYTVAEPFWAKKQDLKGYYEWLPLGQHLEDTRQIAGLLWEHWLSQGQKTVIKEGMLASGDEIAKQVVEFLGAVHDIAKATPAFQVKKGYGNSSDFDSLLIERLENFGFSGLGLKDLANISSSPHALAGQVLLEKFGVNQDIASIIGGHHGKPVDEENILINQKAYSSNYYQDDEGSVRRLWEDQQRAILRRALEVAGFQAVDDLPSINQKAQVLLSGLLIMADWIASNTTYFPLIACDSDEVIDQVERIQKGWYDWFSTSPIDFKARTSDYLYETRFKFASPRDVQKVFTDTIEACEHPGIFILEAPMGLGKTEAALAGAEILAAKTGRSGLFFGLPTQATSDGLFPRIEDWLEKVALDYDDTVSIQLVHGKSALNPNFQNLARQIEIDNDDFTNGSVQVNQWFRGRKTSNLDDFVVGTVDQFLMVALKQKHLALRHLGFSKKVVIIDEVHAYDSYMNQYLYQALKWMGAYQVPVIILSATLPADSRWELVKAYLDGAGASGKEIRKMKTSLLYDSYPLITYTDGHLLKQEANFKPAEKETEVQIHQIQDEDLMGLLDSWMENPGNIGIIVNTVRRAQTLGKMCMERYGSEYVDILHSSFIATDRKLKEQELMAHIGKDGDRPERHIYIGTQVMEQSLDIDFDVLVTDLAPMDLLIQRMGRLHRHERADRPDNHSSPHVYVLGTSDQYEFEPGSSAVYGDYLLIRTQEILPDEVRLPIDISPLVQKVYDESIDVVLKEEQEKYDRAAEAYWKMVESKKSSAQNYKIASPPRKHKTIIGWLSNTHPNGTEEYGYAQVRDSDESIEVILLKQYGQGYGLLSEQEDISNDIQDASVAKRLAQETIKLPGALSKGYNIDQTIETLEQDYLRYLSDWDQQPWLKGQLGLILDNENKYLLNGYIITYDEKFGLGMRKEGENESI